MALPLSKVVPKASALFLPYEIKLYKHWRRSALGIADESDDDILLPTAFEYMDFQQWRAKQRETARKPGRGFDSRGKVARSSICGFFGGGAMSTPVTPWGCAFGCSTKTGRGNKWLDSGGPWRVSPPGSNGEDCHTGRRAYYKRKTDLVNEVDNLEDVARLEAVWETAHPAADIEVARAYSAKKAVEVYAKGVQFPARLADVDQMAPRTPVKNGCKKRLSYSPDTPEDTRHRSSVFYSRSCIAYDPGSPYHCPDDEGWAETSFTTSWEYSVRQCRTLLCDKDPSQPNVTYRELTDDDSKDNLVNGIEEWFSMMQEDWKGPWVNILLTTTDMFIVWRGPPYIKGRENDFNNWDRAETLVGTNLEAHARWIGDVTGGTDTEEVEGEIMEDFFDQNSFASDSDSDEEEDEVSDPMDLEDDDNEDEDMAVGIAGQEHQPGQTVFGEDAGAETCYSLHERSRRKIMLSLARSTGKRALVEGE